MVPYRKTKIDVLMSDVALAIFQPYRDLQEITKSLNRSSDTRNRIQDLLLRTLRA